LRKARARGLESSLAGFTETDSLDPGAVGGTDYGMLALDRLKEETALKKAAAKRAGPPTT
jgi:hypothetical protein